MWQKTLQPFVETDRLVVVGVVQEQHADRARLYAQWRQYGWPIFVDSLNLLDLEVVPVPVAIDASGIVRDQQLTPKTVVSRFIEAKFPKIKTSVSFNRAAIPDIASLLFRAEEQPTAKVWSDLGDACFLLNYSDQHAQTHDRSKLCDPVLAYSKGVQLDPTDGRLKFRLGVALLQRSESKLRHQGDAQEAIRCWGEALRINPNQYVWRRRIQQYGPRLNKPYNFYFWVAQARKEIIARGDEPVALDTEPQGSELEPPLRRRDTSGTDKNGSGSAVQANACGLSPTRIHVDSHNFIEIDPMSVPAKVRPGDVVRLRINFRVNPKSRPFWNNEADDLAVCLDLSHTVKLGEGQLTYPNPDQPETRDMRTVEFEIAVAKSVKDGPLDVPAHALYYVCENRGGKCRYLRNDFNLSLHVDRHAPVIQR